MENEDEDIEQVTPDEPADVNTENVAIVPDNAPYTLECIIYLKGRERIKGRIQSLYVLHK